MGWNGESREELPKDVSCVADKTCFGVLVHTQTNVILESWMVNYVSFVRKRDQKNVTCDTVQRPREKEDVVQFSWETNRLDV